MADDATVEQLRAENRRLRAERDADRAELERRDRALAEALEQQLAMAEILGAIASPSIALQAVLDAVVASAGRLCGAEIASVARVVGDEMIIAASTDPELAGL